MSVAYLVVALHKCSLSHLAKPFLLLGGLLPLDSLDTLTFLCTWGILSYLIVEYFTSGVKYSAITHSCMSHI